MAVLRQAEELGKAFYRGEAESYADLFAGIETTPRWRLGEAAGITDVELLDRLLDLGIRPETLAALTLVPLIEVAWADGRMEPEEREAVLRGAESTGLGPDTPSYRLLRIWTEDRPPQELIAAWRVFVGSVCLELSPDERSRFRDRVMDRAREVAAAAGGLLGVGAVSRQERDVLVELKGAFEV